MDDLPDCTMSDELVELAEFEYSERLPTDYVVSGPLGETNGRGRWFETTEQALAYYRNRFGPRFRGLVKDAEIYGDKYAFIIKQK